MLGAMKQMQSLSTVGGTWLAQMILPPFSSNKAYFSSDTITVDNAQNIYVAGYNALDTKSVPAVYKINSAGSFLWGQNYTYGNSTTGTSYTSYNAGLVGNATQGNVYALDSSAGLLYFNGTTGSNQKYLIYQSATNVNPPGGGVAMKQSTNGNLVIGVDGQFPLFNLVAPSTGTPYNKNVIYYNGSVTGATLEYSGLKIQTDKKPGSTNTYTSLNATRIPTAGSTRNCVITQKYNSLNALQWGRGIAHTGFSFDISQDGMTPDYTGGNVYVGWRLASNETTNSYITKYYPGLGAGDTVAWTVGLTANPAGATSSTINSILVSDISDNVYGIGRNSVGVYNTVNIVKYNSNGTLQWQRTLQGVNPTTSGNLNLAASDAVISGNNLVISMNVTDFSNYTAPNIATIKYLGTMITSLPVDGTATGTYTVSTAGGYDANNISLTYATSSYSGATAWANIDLNWTGYAFNVTSGSPGLTANTTAINSITANSTSSFGGPLIITPKNIP